MADYVPVDVKAFQKISDMVRQETRGELSLVVVEHAEEDVVACYCMGQPNAVKITSDLIDTILAYISTMYKISIDQIRRITADATLERVHVELI